MFLSVRSWALAIVLPNRLLLIWGEEVIQFVSGAAATDLVPAVLVFVNDCLSLNDATAPLLACLVVFSLANEKRTEVKVTQALQTEFT